MGAYTKDMDKETNKSIANLAMMVANGFSGMDKKLDELETRLNERFDMADKRFNEVDTAVFSLDGKVAEISKSLKRVEESLEPLLTGYKIMQKEIGELSLRIDRLEEIAAVHSQPLH